MLKEVALCSHLHDIMHATMKHYSFFELQSFLKKDNFTSKFTKAKK